MKKIRFNFYPKNIDFFAYFRNDAANLKDGVLVLKDLVDNYTDVEAKYLKLRDIEHKGDVITHEIFSKLRETFITPLEREDIHNLASGIDDVLDCIEGVASRMHFFKVPKPTPEIKILVEILHKAVLQIVEAIDNMANLSSVDTFCVEINRLENEADVVCREAIARLFEATREIEHLKDLMKFKEIYSRLESASDRCEDVANTIEEIIVKSA